MSGQDEYLAFLRRRLGDTVPMGSAAYVEFLGPEDKRVVGLLTPRVTNGD
jgi:hypothetical protein